jgi:hypothetical protein
VRLHDRTVPCRGGGLGVPCGHPPRGVISEQHSPGVTWATRAGFHSGDDAVRLPQHRTHVVVRFLPTPADPASTDTHNAYALGYRPIPSRQPVSIATSANAGTHASGRSVICRTQV